ESGVVGLRNLLPATPTPTQTQLNTIATPPTLSDSRMTFGAYTITAASPAPNRQTFAAGPYSGLFGWVQGYSIQAQVNGQGGTKWSSAGAWASQAMQTFGGQVQDSAMGVQQIVPPLPDLFGNPTNPDVVAHQLIEMPQAGDSPALASAKMYSQAGLRIIANNAGPIQAFDANGNGVTLPLGAVSKNSFYDARESKILNGYDVYVH